MRWKVATATLLVVVATGIVVRTQFIDTVTVSSDSMAPTVCTGDTLVLARLDGDDSAKVGDIITFPSPEDGRQAIKRVVAVAGQRVAIADADLLVDGKKVDEPYVDHRSIDGVYFGTVTVPPGSVFVMGDHRENSIDSREYGSIRTSVINGRLLFKVWSNCGNQ